MPLRPIRSPTLLPIRMNAADTSASSAIDRTLLTVVSIVDDRGDRHVYQGRVHHEDEHRPTDRKLPILLAMAMFVLVVDTSLMNVSIASVVDDLDTTVSSVQSAIALEALVSAAFILIGSKVGDLIGRKRAYVLGLLGYAIGAAVDGAGAERDGDHRLLGDPRRARRVAAAAGDAVADPRQLRGRRSGARSTPWSARRPRSPPRSDRCSAGSSPPTCRGGSRSCSRSSSSRSSCPASGSSATCRTRVPPRRRGRLGAVRRRHGRHRAGHPGVAGGRRVRRRAPGRSAPSRWRRWCGGCVRRKRQRQADAARPGPVPVQGVPARHQRADAPADRARRHDDRAADLPADGARVQRHGGRPVARPVVAEHVRRGARRREEGGQPPPEHASSGPGSCSWRSGWWCSSRSCRGPTPAGTWWSR